MNNIDIVNKDIELNGIYAVVKHGMNNVFGEELYLSECIDQFIYCCYNMKRFYDYIKHHKFANKTLNKKIKIMCKKLEEDIDFCMIVAFRNYREHYYDAKINFHIGNDDEKRLLNFRIEVNIRDMLHRVHSSRLVDRLKPMRDNYRQRYINITPSFIQAYNHITCIYNSILTIMNQNVTIKNAAQYIYDFYNEEVKDDEETNYQYVSIYKKHINKFKNLSKKENCIRITWIMSILGRT